MFRKKDDATEHPKRHKAYKFRIYPSDEQIVQIVKTIGCSRFVYNHFLNQRIMLYKMTNTSMNVTDCNNDCNQLKNEPGYAFLKEVDKFAMTNALMDQQKAFNNFFRERAKGNRKQGFPRFRSKHGSRQSYTTNMTNGNIKVSTDEKHIQLPKLGKVPFKPGKNPRTLEGAIKSATVSMTSEGKFYVAVLTETVLDEAPVAKTNYTQAELDSLLKDNEVIAADLGLTHFAILATGEKIDNPRCYQASQKKLRKLQKKLARQKKGSISHTETKEKIARLHRYIANSRKDFLHKLSNQWVNENQVMILEDLHVKGLVRNRRLSKAISDVGWGMFKGFLAYKANWQGKTLVLIDRFYPSSKLCSACSEKNPMLTLSDRQWKCPNCQTVHDRDINAATNILHEGLRQLAA